MVLGLFFSIVSPRVSSLGSIFCFNRKLINEIMFVVLSLFLNFLVFLAVLLLKLFSFSCRLDVDTLSLSALFFDSVLGVFG